MGFVQVSGAGVISTEQMIDSEVRQEQLTRLESFLLRQDVADQLIEYGVAPETVMARIQHMTSAELAALEGKIDEQVAGGDALAIIGTVFLVLLILELVGVTDIFKSI
jgi:siroheme synthase